MNIRAETPVSALFFWGEPGVSPSDKVAWAFVPRDMFKANGN